MAVSMNNGLPMYGTSHGKLASWLGIPIPDTVELVQTWTEPITMTEWVGWKNTNGTYGKAEMPHPDLGIDGVKAVIMAMRLSY